MLPINLFHPFMVIRANISAFNIQIQTPGSPFFSIKGFGNL